MGKKSQTSARRKNTQVGAGVVNLYNHGTINVDAHQSTTFTAPKVSYSNCTFYPNLDIKPITLRDNIEDCHPILDMIRPSKTRKVGRKTSKKWRLTMTRAQRGTSSFSGEPVP